MSALASLLVRDLKRLVRRPSQIVAVAGFPLMFLLFFAAGLGEQVGPGDAYSAYLIPGAVVLAVVFASMFAGMSLIEDRHEGALRAMLISPTPSSTLAIGRVLGATLIATAQAGPILLLSPLAGVGFSPLGLLAAFGALALTSAMAGGVSVWMAWKIDSPRGFHGVQNLAFVPLWLLSGAVFTPDSAAGWLVMVPRFNPMGWSRDAMASALSLETSGSSWVAWIGLAVGAIVGIAIAVASMRKGH